MATSPERRCPTCGALVRWTGDAAVVECRYCQTHIDTRSWATTQRSAQVRSRIPGTRLVTLLVAALVLALVAGTVALLIHFDVAARWLGTRAASSTTGSRPPTTAGAASVPIPSGGATDSVAGTEPPDAAAPTLQLPVRVVLEFGEQGDANGQFTDPRQIAVDGEGHIFVADYRALRVQRFDPSGEFLQVYKLRRGSQSEFITGLAADDKGHIWVSRGGDLLKLRVRSGRLVSAKLHRAPKLSYGAVAVAPSGAVYVQNFGSTSSMSSTGPAQTDHLRKLSATGRLLRRWKTDVPSGPIAIDQAGNVFVADRQKKQIDVLGSTGEISTRIGGPEQGDLGLGFITSLAVDGEGRLFVLAGDIHVFDASGKRIGHFDSKGARSLAVDAGGALYAVTSYCRVMKYQLLREGESGDAG